MNLIKELEEAFNKYDLNEFNRLRYIYYFFCWTFSYDTRYMYALSDLKHQIYEFEQDPTNIQEFETTCYTQAKLLKRVLNYFDYNCWIEMEKLHAYVVVDLNGRQIKMDPSKKYDTARVKLYLDTYDFDTLISDPTFMDDLKDADSTLRELGAIPVNDKLKKDRDLMLQYISRPADYNNNGINNLLSFFNSFNAVVALINSMKFTRFNEVFYYLNYLIKRGQLSRCGKNGSIIKTIVLFNNDDPTMRDMMGVVLIELSCFEPAFFVIENKDGYYTIDEANAEYVSNKLEQYSNLGDVYFQNAADRALKVIKDKPYLTYYIK